MKYWLVKSEPNAWSWDEHVAAGIAEWDGVRSHQACNNMKAMKVGDKAFFYHSVDERRIVGVVEVAGEISAGEDVTVEIYAPPSWLKRSEKRV